MNERSGPGFLAGMLTGALIGAGLAMLLAPWSGEETRDVLRAKAREASNLAKDAVADLSDQARSVAGDTAANVGDAYGKGAAALDGMKRTLEEARAEGAGAAAQQRADLEQRYFESGQSE